MCVTQILPVLLHPQARLYPAYPAMGIKLVCPDSSSAPTSGNRHCSVLRCFLARYLKEMSTVHVCLSILLSSSANSSVFFWFNFFHIDQERSWTQCQQGGRKVSLIHATPAQPWYKTSEQPSPEKGKETHGRGDGFWIHPRACVFSVRPALKIQGLRCEI